jgi:hypothetical protein
MKQDSQIFGGTAVGVAAVNLEGLATGLACCVVQFDQDNGLSVIERTVRIAFSNGVFLALRHPGDAATMLDQLKEAGVPYGRDVEAIIEAFQGFQCEGNWVAVTGEKLDSLWGPEARGAECLPEGVRRILFALFAGLYTSARIPEVAAAIDGYADQPTGLNYESRFLASRLIAWRHTNWAPVAQPFVEFAAQFYAPGSKESEVICGAVGEVLMIAVTLSDPWSVKLWAETGWWAGRKIGTQQPELMREMFAEVPKEDLLHYVGLYQRCVLATLSASAVKPERAALRYFGLTGRDVYARALCRGDEPRFVARAAYDFAFWMGLLSTQPMPSAGN